jgi:PAS domain S-box-containing protein
VNKRAPAPEPRILEEDAEDLYDNSPCGYLSALPDGRIVKINRTLLNLLGYSREEILGQKKFQDLLTIGGKIFFETHFAPLLKMQTFANEINFDIVRKNGETFPALTSTQSKSAADGSVIHRITVFDISDRKKYEHELRLQKERAHEAMRAKADFLSMMSHEIRTPMNALVGITHLLEATELSPQQGEYMRMLKASSENLLSLLNGILEMSKMESGVVQLEEIRFEPAAVLGEVVQGLEVIAREKNLALILETDPALPRELLGDPVKFRQIFMNLIGNAIKFTEKGSVRVRITVPASGASLVTLRAEVIDTGIGIPAGRLAAVFDQFEQASKEIGAKYGGTGLGLSITRKLVEMYGGKLDVDSEPGRGSNFHFEIQLRTAGRQNAETPPSDPLDPTLLRGLKLLVAEDNEDNIYILSRLLSRWGIEADYAPDGERAVEMAAAGGYDLALLDIRMPKMDGYEAAAKIRALPGRGRDEFPMIALSASARLDGLDEGRLQNFNGSVGKPFRPGHLFERIAKLTGRLQ